jgi:release factor glutamine methyltransferase
MGEVYKPDEDSYLMQYYVEKLVSGKVLDMGTGSGIQAVSAALEDNVLHVLAVDINPAALVEAEKRAIMYGVLDRIDFQLSDLFENITGCFDWILFNPPYLPSEGEIDETSWAGGENGGDIIKRFLVDAKNYLTKNGSILMIYSSKSKLLLDDFHGYNFKILEEKELFFEKIYCVKLNPS